MWVDINGYNGIYQINENGDIRSTRYNKIKILKPWINKGYLQIGLFNTNGEEKRILVHRLVALTFIPNYDNKPLVNHINAIRNDNRVENLEWVTDKENINHSITLRKKLPRTPNLINDFYHLIEKCKNIDFFTNDLVQLKYLMELENKVKNKLKLYEKDINRNTK